MELLFLFQLRISFVRCAHSSWTFEEKLHIPMRINVLYLWLKRKHNRSITVRDSTNPQHVYVLFWSGADFTRKQEEKYYIYFKPSLSRTSLIDILLLPLDLIASRAQRELVYTWQIKNWSCLPFSARKQYFVGAWKAIIMLRSFSLLLYFLHVWNVPNTVNIFEQRYSRIIYVSFYVNINIILAPYALCFAAKSTIEVLEHTRGFRVRHYP